MREILEQLWKAMSGPTRAHVSPTLRAVIPLWTRWSAAVATGASRVEATRAVLSPLIERLRARYEEAPEQLIEQATPLWTFAREAAHDPAARALMRRLGAALFDASEVQLERFVAWLDAPEAPAQLDALFARLERAYEGWLERNSDALFGLSPRRS